MKDLIAYIVVFNVAFMFLAVFVNYIALKIYFLTVLRKDYYELWESIGSPKFWQSTENIESILSLVNNPNLVKGLNNKLKISLLIHKAANLNIIIAIFIILSFSVVEYFLNYID